LDSHLYEFRSNTEDIYKTCKNDQIWYSVGLRVRLRVFSVFNKSLFVRCGLLGESVTLILYPTSMGRRNGQADDFAPFVPAGSTSFSLEVWQPMTVRERSILRETLELDLCSITIYAQLVAATQRPWISYP
jgi:hypothetical protein